MKKLLLTIGMMSAWLCTSARADPVEQMRALAERCKAAWDGEPTVIVRKNLAGSHYKTLRQVSGFEYDVLKSTSLVAPYSGTLRVEIKTVSQNANSPEEAQALTLNINSKWTLSVFTLLMEYRNGKWSATGATKRDSNAWDYDGPRIAVGNKSLGLEVIRQWTQPWQVCQRE